MLVDVFACDCDCLALGDEVAIRCPIPVGLNAGYLYAVEIGTGLTKVGISRNPALRFVKLRTDASCKFQAELGHVVVTRACSNFKVLESHVLGVLSDFCVGGEYFRMPLSSVRSIFLGLDFADPVPSDPDVRVTFREYPKAALQAQIPIEIFRAVMLRALEEGKRPNQLVAELLCQELEIDPTIYGLGSDSRYTSN